MLLNESIPKLAHSLGFVDNNNAMERQQTVESQDDRANACNSIGSGERNEGCVLASESMGCFGEVNSTRGLPDVCLRSVVLTMLDKHTKPKKGRSL